MQFSALIKMSVVAAAMANMAAIVLALPERRGDQGSQEELIKPGGRCSLTAPHDFCEEYTSCTPTEGLDDSGDGVSSDSSTHPLLAENDYDLTKY